MAARAVVASCRVAPVGLIGAHEPFRLGCELAAITHGHPSGYLSAGFLAHLIHLLFEGQPLERAIQTAADELRRWPQHAECLAAVEAAVALAQAGPATPERLQTLGGGWVGEEAMAI